MLGQETPTATKEKSQASPTAEARLIAVLKSDAPRKAKADACRELARIGTRDSIGPLASLLCDEQLSHMARYGLEPIPDPAVDTALRDAAGKASGRQLLDTQTLMTAEVRDGDVLRLQPEITAGGPT